MSALKEKPAGLIVSGFHDEARVADGQDLTLLARLLPYLRPHALLAICSLLLMPLAALGSLLQPYLIKGALDAVLVEKSLSALQSVVLFFMGAVTLEFVARFGQLYLIQLAGQRSMADLRRGVFAHLQTLPVGHFDDVPIGRVVTRVTNDVDSLTEFFTSGAVTAVADLLMLFGVVAFMVYLDWRLTLVALAVIPPLALLIAVFRRYARAAFRDIRARIAQLNAYLSEQVQGLVVVQAFSREERCAGEYETINAAYRDANYRAIRFDALLYSVVQSVSIVCVTLVLFYAASTAGGIEDPALAAAYVGTVVAFYQYISLFFVPIRDLSQKYTIIQSSLASAERIFQLLDVDKRDAPTQSTDLLAAPDADAAITFDEVSFAYREGVPVLKSVDFNISPGEMIAIVGATGSGKTTVTSLLLRLYEHQQGGIFLQGEDIRGLERHALRRRFAVVPQDVFLFTGTVLENVALGEAEIDEERARDALARVGLLDRLESREGGLNARVAERGTNWSAGERQLIAFARALYKDPELLILDEATANIDSETEAKIQSAVDELLEGRTSLVIAHRLSTVRRADRILVFHAGEVAEHGTHTELMEQGGIYAKLHELQFSGAEAV